MKTLPPLTPKIDLPVSELVLRYEKGESTPALGRAYGVDRGTICRRLSAAGVELRRRGWLGLWGKKNGMHRPGGPLFHTHGHLYLTTIDREKKNCLVHRACWEAHHGPIPEGFVIHHENEDRTDNRIENLACMEHGEHTSWHRRRAAEHESLLATEQ